MTQELKTKESILDELLKGDFDIAETYKAVLKAMDIYAAQFKPAPPVSREAKSEVDFEKVEYDVRVIISQMSCYNTTEDEGVSEILAIIKQNLQNHASAYPINVDVEKMAKEVAALHCTNRENAMTIKERIEFCESFPDVNAFYDLLKQDIIEALNKHFALSLPNGEKWVSKEQIQAILDKDQFDEDILAEIRKFINKAPKSN